VGGVGGKKKDEKGRGGGGTIQESLLRGGRNVHSGLILKEGGKSVLKRQS